jgi:metal-responsive CopG/Arc/MetJ family transcriptional regulator
MNTTTAKAKTSITLSVSLLVKIDEAIGKSASRSAYIEKVLTDHLRREAREAINQRDLELINANAEYLNAEAMDVLRYQAPIVYNSED